MFQNISKSEFLLEYWQKKPLLIRDALPGFEGLLSPEELKTLSSREDVQSRIVAFSEGKWMLENGPFSKKYFRDLPSFWTLLVQGVNHVLRDGEKLLGLFDFIPRARLDDLMVSYAPDGCGVGPHFDSYDVFLLQGMGNRKWQISSRKDMDLVPDAPLRILSRFEPEQEWMLAPGDMLYLPPKYAHNGIAVGESMTYSIGFRAPSHQELATQFLVYLQDHFEISGMYEDPDLELQDHPAQIGRNMLEKVGKAISSIRWDEKEVEKFLGLYLSEPKPHLFFDPPSRPLSRKSFIKRIGESGIRLDLRSEMLFTEEAVFINGERIPFGNLDRNLLVELADRRGVSRVETRGETEAILYQWYSEGYIGIGGEIG